MQTAMSPTSIKILREITSEPHSSAQLSEQGFADEMFFRSFWILNFMIEKPQFDILVTYESR